MSFKEIIEKEKNEIITTLIKQGNANRTIDYSQLLGLYAQYKEIMTETRLKKREMDMDENIANFRVAENELQTLLDEVSVLIGRSVSEHIKIPTGNPFFEGASCSGGCGSGSGCGCSS